MRFDSTTLRGNTDPDATSSGEVRVPALTIAYHPRCDRVGQTARLPALLMGQRIAVARLEPGFVDGSGGGAGPADDPFLSRKPFWLEGAADGSVVIDPEGSGNEVRLEGQRVERRHRLGSEDLERGVLLFVADRIGLMLHLAGRHGGSEQDWGLVGGGDQMRSVRREIARVAGDHVPVLLRGETGTGKELVARAIHEASPRTRGPYLTVNMGVIPESTAASELFGHTRGAFTGASEPHRGLFGRAHGGTLFMDEIGALPRAVQPMLLRTLETGEIQPVGGRASESVDVRVIAATDADLEAATAAGSFSSALLHRLAGYEIRLPPLRHRREDLGPLLVHLLADALGEDAGRLYEGSSRGSPWLSPSLAERLLLYDWPGNVRQLRNLAKQIAIASRGEDTARLPPAVDGVLPRPTGSAVAAPPAPRAGRAKLEEISDAEVLESLTQNAWKIEASARALGVSKNSLYRLMERSPSLRKGKDLTREQVLEAQGCCDGDLERMSAHLHVSKHALLLRMGELDL